MSLISAHASPNNRHVIVMVWDGMRPDFINATNTPNLWQLAQRGVFFNNHHPVYVSTTEVNGTAIATGTYPAINGIIANKEYRPLLDESNSFHTEDFDFVRHADELTRGHYIEVPTTAEILAGKGVRTAVAGAKPVALLHDRLPRTANSPHVTLFAGRTLPPEALAQITSLNGAFPAAANKVPNRNDWTADSLINPLWENGLPAFSVLWMSEPDASQHQTGPGSAKSLEAIRVSDSNLGKVVAALEARHVLDQTDIMVVSDHGFSTISAILDTAESLRNAGFHAYEKLDRPPVKDDIMFVTTGGSALLYVTGHSPTVIQGLVDFFQKWGNTGVIFTRKEMPGTFAMSQVKIDSANAPDIIISFRWSDAKSENGTPGLLVCNEAVYRPGQGMHGSLSKFDMHNTFVAAGPDFKSGIVDQLPTGNVDIAPTALHLLGYSAPRTMKGRVVSEALVGGSPRISSYQPTHLTATKNLGDTTWQQYLNVSEVNGTVYFDEGNGEQMMNK